MSTTFLLGEWDIDGPGARGGAETPVESLPTGIERVATSPTSVSVAERDVGRGHKADGARSVETGTVSFVNRTVASANGPTAAAAINDPRVEGVALGERAFGAAGEGKARISGVEPVVELCVADDGCFDVPTLWKYRLAMIDTCSRSGRTIRTYAGLATTMVASATTETSLRVNCIVYE